jgi:hypothetical protein
VGYRKARTWFLALIVIPFALFVPYWGWGRSGLMREALHAWFFGLNIFAVFMWYRFLRRRARFFRLCNWALLARGVETLCVLLVPTIATQDAIAQPPFRFSDSIALAAMLVLTGALYTLTFQFAEQLRRSYANRMVAPHPAIGS